MRYFIIEHPTRGIVMDWDWDEWKKEWKFRFSWSKPRSDAHRFSSMKEAREKFDLMPPRVKSQAYIMEYSDEAIFRRVHGFGMEHWRVVKGGR